MSNMNLTLNEQLGEVCIPRATSVFMEVRKSRTTGRWKIIVKWPSGASPSTLEETDTFKVVIKFEDTPTPEMFLTATNDTEECIHFQYMENPPSPTGIALSSPEDIRQVLISVHSETRFYISPAGLLDSDSASSRCGGASRREVNSGIEEFHVSLVDRREILIARLAQERAEDS